MSFVMTPLAGAEVGVMTCGMSVVPGNGTKQHRAILHEADAEKVNQLWKIFWYCLKCIM